jgi:hypothetical protein
VKREQHATTAGFLDEGSSRIWWFCLVIILLLIIFSGHSFGQASISGYVWMDANQNGLQEESERGFSGVRVQLFRQIGSQDYQELTSLRTESNGHYIFIVAGELLPGDFYLQFEDVPGFYHSPPDQGADDLVDSDVDSSSGRTPAFLVTNMSTANGWSAGYMSSPLNPPVDPPPIDPPPADPIADVAVLGGSIPDSARIGQELTFRFQVINYGPDSAKEVLVYFPIAGLIEVFATEPAAENMNANPLRWFIPALAQGANRDFRVHLRVLADGVIHENICAYAQTRETMPGNNCTEFAIDLTVPVELVSFSGRMENESVHLRWVTASETENLGFHLYRAGQKEGPYTSVTTQLIAGAGTTSSENRYDFLDNNVIPDHTYFYKLSDTDYAGYVNWHGPIEVTTTPPATFELAQNFPNPFNAQTRIQFRVGQAARYELIIFNHIGQEIRRLINHELSPGMHEILWDGVDGQNLPVASGIYYYMLRNGEYTQKKAMHLIK